MKPENTLENKGKFFALYWGQYVLKIKGIEPEVHKVIDWFKFDDCHLELKPLSSITDEDAITVAKLNTHINWENGNDPVVFKNSFGHTVVSNGQGLISKYGQTIVTDMDYLSLEQCDFLRSRGYLLAWMGLTPDEIVSRGWAKIKEDNHEH